MSMSKNGSRPLFSVSEVKVLCCDTIDKKLEICIKLKMGRGGGIA